MIKIVACILALLLVSLVHATPLDDYVNKADPNYKWEDMNITLTGVDDSWTGYVVNMTSQQWLTSADTNHPIWWHICVVIVPKTIKHKDSAFLWITGNNNNGNIPKADDEDIIVTAYTAVVTGTIGVSLFQIPNQPITFAADPEQKGRTEDALVGFSLYEYIQMNGSDPEWLVFFPMVKAGVSALNMVTEWAAKKYSYSLTDMYVCGASKRGWTTWLVAATDTRVKAFAPVVFDELEFVRNLHHHYRAYGGWSFAFEDYWSLNITRDLDSPQLAMMMDIIDPVQYVSRYADRPKMVCDAGMDEFFLPDDQHYWWNELTDPKWLIMLPNTEHSIATGVLELLPALATFFDASLNDNLDKVPTYTWSIDNTTGEITVKTSEEPDSVHVWHATTCNADRRDFRVLNLDDPCHCGVAADGYCLNLKVVWEQKKIEASDTLTYKALEEAPTDGRWTAFFIDVKFNFNEGADPNRLGWPITPPGVYEFTSGVSIVPLTFPFEDCEGVDCLGVLV